MTSSNEATIGDLFEAARGTGKDFALRTWNGHGLIGDHASVAALRDLLDEVEALRRQVALLCTPTPWAEAVLKSLTMPHQNPEAHTPGPWDREPITGTLKGTFHPYE